jgi:hypothetical protein
MKAIRSHFDRSQLESEGKVAVQRALALVKKDKAVSQSFHTCVRKLGGGSITLSGGDIEQLHDKLMKKAFHSRIQVVFKDFKEDALNNQAGATKIDLRTKLLASEELSGHTKNANAKPGANPAEHIDPLEYITQEEYHFDDAGDDELCCL